MPFRRTLLTAALAFGVLATACGGSDDPNVSSPSGSAASANLAASVASSDLWAKAPMRFQLGVFKSDDQGVELLSFGTVSFSFSFLGDGSAAPVAGPTATGTYLGAFGTPQDAPAQTFSPPSEARGVYQAEGVTFEQPGIWQVDTSLEVPGTGPQTLSSQFPVAAKPSLPAPGDLALRTDNLTMDSKGVPASTGCSARSAAERPPSDRLRAAFRAEPRAAPAVRSPAVRHRAGLRHRAPPA